MEIRKNKVILISLASVILILLIVFFCSPYSTALLKSKSYFIKNSYDNRVLYEPGAEEYAGKIAVFLPAAIERVEQVHIR